MRANNVSTPKRTVRGGDLKMGAAFLFLGFASAAAGFMAESWIGRILGISSAISFWGVAAAYIFRWPGLIGKKRSGTMLLSSYALFWPFHILNHLSLALFRWSRRSAPFTEIVPGLYLGSRLSTRDARRLCELKISAVLDMTSEFSEVRSLREIGAYLCIPLLDRTPPSPPEFEAAISFIREQLQRGPVYVHCALGHGRSATIVLAYLIACGRFANIGEAMAHVQSKRPRVRLNYNQLRALQEFAV